MGWDYHVYEAQPDYFIDQILVKMRLDEKKRVRDEKDSKRRSKKR